MKQVRFSRVVHPGIALVLACVGYGCGSTSLSSLRPSYPSSPRPADPILLFAELDTYTGNDNKDGDTSLSCSVKTSSGTAIAGVTNADSYSGDDRWEYNDHSFHITRLLLASKGMTYSVCKNFGFCIKHKPNGDDRWILEDSRVTLFFSDGSTLQKSSGPFTLDIPAGASEPGTCF